MGLEVRVVDYRPPPVSSLASLPFPVLRPESQLVIVNYLILFGYSQLSVGLPKGWLEMEYEGGGR